MTALVRRKALRRALLCALVACTASFNSVVYAQNTYDPNAPTGAQPSYGQQPYGTGSQGAGQPGTALIGGVNSGVTGVTGANAVNGAGASGNGGFSPVVIPNPVLPNPGSNVPEDATVSVVRPPAAGAAPTPLYARPTETRGQFELFTRPPPQPGEFEAFVRKVLGRPLRRFGADLILNGNRGFVVSSTAAVPPDYRLNPGDELVIGVTGSVEANIRSVIDSEGRIFIPRVGAINVAGVRYGDLQAALARKFNAQYRQAKVSVVVARLHGLTVYVTGYAVTPGAYSVSSLSTAVDAALAAGGPSAGGSFRRVEVRRGGELITEIDLYDLLLRGDKSHDVMLENGDVINLAAAGPQLAITGSVNAEAIYEAKAGETLADLIRDAGGTSSLADETRLIVSRLGDLDLTGSQQITFAQARGFPAERGDIVRVLSLANIARPLERQAILATIEGEVDHPGRFYLPPGSTLSDLLARAGGLTSGAFVFGTALDRDSVLRQQRASFDRAIDDLQLAAAASPLNGLNGTADRAATAAVRQQATLGVIDALRSRTPDGRIVLDTPYGSNALPTSLPLEDNDHIYIPPLPKTVGVFGAVFQPGSFLLRDRARLGDYLRMSGGPQHFADRKEIFVVRANGSVLSSRQSRGFDNRYALPGDVIFVPVRTSPGFLERLRVILDVVSQFGLSAAALAVLAHQ